MYYSELNLGENGPRYRVLADPKDGMDNGVGGSRLDKFLARELFSKEICEDLNVENRSSVGRYLLKKKKGSKTD